jgi:branched-chain amino acid transport system permease protein
MLAQSVGINIAAYKLIAFVIACFFAGLAGSFYTHYLILANPDAFTMWDSIFVVAYVVIGGMGSVLGPIIGTVLLVGGFELLRELSNYQTVGYALILLLVTRFLPGGLISLGPLTRERISRLPGRREKLKAAKKPNQP